MFGSSPRFLPCTAAAALFFLHACKKPDTLGVDVLPAADAAGLVTVDTMTLTAEMVREDSLLTRSDFAAHLLGALADPVFGRTSAALYMQLRLTGSNPDFGPNPVCDSVVLALVFSGYYGDTLNATHRITVYELDEAIHKDSSRYTHNKPAVKTPEISSYETGEVFPKDSVEVNGVKAPQFLVRVDKAFGDKILTAGSANLASAEAFSGFIKGLYLEDSLAAGSQDGCIMYFNLTSSVSTLPQSRLIIYYHDDTAAVKTFSLNINSGAHFNYFTHDYSTAVFANQFGDPQYGQQFGYLQSLAGVKVRVDIPYYEELNKAGPVAINKAFIEFYVDGSQVNDKYKAHESLALTGIDSTGQAYFLPDNLDNPLSYGGDLVSGTYYQFAITRYLQQVLNGDRKNYGLFLVAKGATVNANRTVVGGSQHATLGMRLRVIYTVID
jgi:hypothetical protein